MLRRRPLFPRASAALSAGWGQGCASPLGMAGEIRSVGKFTTLTAFDSEIHRATCGGGGRELARPERGFDIFECIEELLGPQHFKSEVPPRKARYCADCGSAKSTDRVQQTQKSFSTWKGGNPMCVQVSVKRIRRSFAGSAAMTLMARPPF